MAYGDSIGYSGAGSVRFCENRPEMDDETTSLGVEFVLSNAFTAFELLDCGRIFALCTAGNG